MNQKNLRRIVAGTSTIALAGGLTAILGMGTAGAEGADVSWTDSYTTFKRTVSNTTPAVGDQIVMTTTFGRTGDKPEKISSVKDLHHPCLTLVTAYPANNLTTGTEKPGQAFTRVELTTGWWNDPGKALPFTFTYEVGESCPIGVPLTSAFHYGGGFGHGEYENKGPNITVRKGASATTATLSRALQSGRSSTITATVSPTLTGEVEFFNGATSLGKATLANGTAALDWTPTSGDANSRYSITAKFLGSNVRADSTSAPLTGTIAAADGTGGVTDGDGDGGTDGGTGSLGSLGNLFGR